MREATVADDGGPSPSCMRLLEPVLTDTIVAGVPETCRHFSCQKDASGTTAFFPLLRLPLELPIAIGATAISFGKGWSSLEKPGAKEKKMLAAPSLGIACPPGVWRQQRAQARDARFPPWRSTPIPEVKR